MRIFVLVAFHIILLINIFSLQSYGRRNDSIKVWVPKKSGFKEFLNVETGPSTNHPSITGFCFDVFWAAIHTDPLLGKLDFYFESCEGTYDDVLQKLKKGEPEMLMGDMTILAERTSHAEFTLPYYESRVVTVVKNRRPRSPWTFLWPLNWDLWLIIFLACIVIGVIFRVLERRFINNVARPHRRHLGLLFLFPIAALAFPERNMVRNNWSKFVLVAWLFMAFFLIQAYTANLSTILTVDQLQDDFSQDWHVGYQKGSFVKHILIDRLHLKASQLHEYSEVEECHEAMQNGTIRAIIDEIPYMKILLQRYGQEYKIARSPTFRTDGLGFAFPQDSTLVAHFSRAILNVTQSKVKMDVFELTNFGKGYSSLDLLVSRTEPAPSLTVRDFGGLFIIIASVILFALFCSETSIGQALTTSVIHFIHRSLSFFSPVIHPTAGAKDDDSENESPPYTVKEDAGDNHGQQNNEQQVPHGPDDQEERIKIIIVPND